MQTLKHKVADGDGVVIAAFMTKGDAFAFALHKKQQHEEVSGKVYRIHDRVRDKVYQVIEEG